MKSKLQHGFKVLSNTYLVWLVELPDWKTISNGLQNMIVKGLQSYFGKFIVVKTLGKFIVVITPRKCIVVITHWRYIVVINLRKFIVVLTSGKFIVLITPGKFIVIITLGKFIVIITLRNLQFIHCSRNPVKTILISNLNLRVVVKSNH